MESLAFVFNELTENREASALRPVSEWVDLLRGEGLNPQELLDFFLSTEAISHLKASSDLRQLYQEAALCNGTTGQFMSNILKEEKGYSQFILSTIDSLLKERKALLATAGGQMKDPKIGWTWIGATAICAIVIGYHRKYLWNEAIHFKNEIKDYFVSKEKQQIKDDIVAHADSNIVNDYTIVRNNNKPIDFFKYEIKIDAKSYDITHEEVRRARARFIENPDRFLTDEIKRHPEIFDITPKGFKAFAKNQYKLDMQKIQNQFQGEVNKQIEEYSKWFDSEIIPDYFLMSGNDKREFIDDAEVDLARETLENPARLRENGAVIAGQDRVNGRQAARLLGL